MDDGQNGAAVAQPPSSDTCGMFVNHQTPPPTLSAAVAIAAPAPPPPMRPAAPSCGAHLNNNNNNSVIKGQMKGPGNPDHRTRRPRRGKRKSKKMPYLKDRMYRRKAVAPNNTNQFLMDDHNDGPDIDLKLLEVSARYNNENGRTRNSSHTSIESDGELMYSSSDEDAASMQKEFCDTYRLVQEEELAGLTKPELIVRVLDLEEKVQVLESTNYRRNIMMFLNGSTKEDEEVSVDHSEIDLNEYKLMKIQIKEMTSKNKALTAELETTKKELQLMKKLKNDSDSSVDSGSSSDSSDSSSSSSDEHEIEMSFLVRSSGRDDHKSKDD